MRSLLPSGDSDNLDVDVDLHAHYALDWIGVGGFRVNFVSSLDGSATVSGLSRGLQTPGDNRVFAALRDLADVIVVGAATATAENYRPARPTQERQATRRRFGLADRPTIAVLSSSLAIDLSAELSAAASPDAPTWIVTTSAAPPERRAKLGAAIANGLNVRLLEIPSQDGVPVDVASELLREAGYVHQLCEGGPHLFAAAARASAVDELCLTVAPLLAGPGGPRITNGHEWPDDAVRSAELVGLLTEDDALFCRYTIR